MRSVARNVRGDEITARQNAMCGTVTVVDDPDDPGDPGDPGDPPEDGLPLGLLAAGGAAVVGGYVFTRDRD